MNREALAKEQEQWVRDIVREEMQRLIREEATFNLEWSLGVEATRHLLGTSYIAPEDRILFGESPATSETLRQGH